MVLLLKFCVEANTKMKRMSTKIIQQFAVAALLVLGAFSALAAPATADEKAMAGNLVSAMSRDDFSAFILNGDPQFQQLKKDQFDQMAGQIGARLKAGYELTYLGDLKKEHFHVTLWRIAFRDGGDDALATLSTKDGKVGGFYIE